jgi:hypothetical protein
MYFPHRNNKLRELFIRKPYQGADPATSQFFRLLRRTPQFYWLPEKPISHDGSLPVLFRSSRKTIFTSFHFSCVGKYCLKKDRDLQIKDIGKLVP